MMIPTNSIDGVSMSVTRDGTNLVSNMPLGEVASQVLEQGTEFEAAVEQFQQIMAEFTTGGSDASPLQEGISASAGMVPPQNASFDLDNASAADGALASSVSANVTEGVSETPSPVVAQESDVSEAVATSCDSPAEEVPASSMPSDWDNAPAVDGAPASSVQESVASAVSGQQAQTSALTTDSQVVQLDESGTTQGTIASQPTQPSVQAVDLQDDSSDMSLPSAAQKRDVPASETAASVTLTEDEIPDSEDIVLQSAPVSVPAQMQVIDVKDVAVEQVQVVAARVAHQVMATPAQVLIEAASAVADTIVVSPGLLRGTGEVQVQLRPDVLEGTVIQISTSAPGALTVQFTPVTENMAELLEKCTPQLVTYLSERIHSVQVAVNVKRDEKLKGANT